MIVRTLNFVCVCFGRYKSESLKVFPSHFFNSAFFEVIARLVFDPISLGFVMTDLEIFEKLPEEVCQSLKSRQASTFELMFYF